MMWLWREDCPSCTQADKLKQAGIEQIVCATVAPAGQVAEWAKKYGNTNSQVRAPLHRLCVVLHSRRPSRFQILLC